MDDVTLEAWNYLLEVVADYEEYLGQLGNLGYAAPNVLYYRDEIQEFLDMFKGNPEADFKGIWTKVKALDEYLQQNKQKLVDEIGYANFKQYLIINDPPQAHWWWYLYRYTSAPAPPPKVWEIWKNPLFTGENTRQEEEEETPAESESSSGGQ